MDPEGMESFSAKKRSFSSEERYFSPFEKLTLF